MREPCAWTEGYHKLRNHMQNSLVKTFWRRWLLAFGLWTAIGLCFAGQLYLSRANIGVPVSWKFAIERSLADWYVFAILSIPVLWLSRHFRLERSQWPRALP